jgi:hypothetical protein
MDKQFDAENPFTPTLKGKDFLDSTCLKKNFSALQGRVVESQTIRMGCLLINYSN